MFAWTMLPPMPAHASMFARVDAERRDLMRALLVGTLLVAAAIALVGGGLMRMPGPSELDMPVFEFSPFSPTPPPPLYLPPSAPAPLAVPAAPVVSPNAVPNPVRESAEPPMVVEETTGGEPSDVPGRPGGPAGPLRIPQAEPVSSEPPSYYEPRDVEPEPIFAPRPVYSDLALQAQVEGVVVLRVLVGSDGRVGRIETIRSVPLLEESARTAVARWTFSPARTNEHAVAAWIIVPFRFTLRDAR